MTTPPTWNTSQRPRWHEILGVVGNVASLTGISLLWFRDKIVWEDALFVVPVVFVLSSLGLGVVTIGFIALRQGFVRLVSKRSVAWRVAYWSIAPPLALGAAIALIAGFYWLVNWFIDAVLIIG